MLPDRRTQRISLSDQSLLASLPLIGNNSVCYTRYTLLDLVCVSPALWLSAAAQLYVTAANRNIFL